MLEQEEETGFEVIKKAYKEKEREEAFKAYSLVFSKMTEENFVTFDEFFEAVKSESEVYQEEKSIDEILKEVEEIVGGIDGTVQAIRDDSGRQRESEQVDS